MNRKGCGRRCKQFKPTVRYYPSRSLGKLTKTTQQSRAQLVFGPRFEHETSQIYSRNATYLTVDSWVKR